MKTANCGATQKEKVPGLVVLLSGSLLAWHTQDPGSILSSTAMRGCSEMAPCCCKGTVLFGLWNTAQMGVLKGGDSCLEPLAGPYENT